MQTTIHGIDKSKYPVRMGKTWYNEEVVQLLTSIRNKKSMNEIATEHERTLGGIGAKLRGLAADYYLNDKKPISEIIQLTGLERDVIIDSIEKREYRAELKDKKKEFKIDAEEKKVILSSPKVDPILEVIKDINTRLQRLEAKVDCLNEKMNKPKIIIKKKAVVNEPYEFVD
jgi:hypothetical protein